MAIETQLGAFVLVIIGWLTYGVVWRLYLSPLSRFPGPKLAALTLWYECYFDVFKPGGGLYIWEIERLHKKYGPIVRISPFELHISDPDFYNNIYASGSHRRDKYAWQIKSGDSAQAMGFTVSHEHHRLRREALNSFFSKRSILRLEGTIRKLVDQLCDRIGDHRDANKVINLSNAYLAFSMDVATTYTFDKNSSLLSQEDFTQKWRDTITAIMQNTAVINHFGWLPRVMEILPGFAAKAIAPDVSVLFELKNSIEDQVKEVISKGNDSSKSTEDGSMFEKLRDSDELPPKEKTVKRMTDEATILVTAASESSAKALALLHFHLLSNPPILKRLRAEIKDMMTDRKIIPSLTKLEQAPYLTAVIKEGLRLHGGITARSQRIAPDEDLRYKDWVIPRGTPMSTSSVFIHRNPDIFPDPLAFNPDRWLVDGPGDCRLDQYLVAFGKGSRNCVGINLGMAEVYIALASVVCKFDMELVDTDVTDVAMERDWYVPQARLGSTGVKARVVHTVGDKW